MLFFESPESQSTTDGFEGSQGKILKLAQLEGEETEVDLRAYLDENEPQTLEIFTGKTWNRQSITVTPTADVGIIRCEITYVQQKPSQFSFATGGGTQKVTTALNTYAQFVADGEEDGPDFKDGINVTKDSIEGVDIKIAQPTFKITKSLEFSEDLDEDYLDDLEILTGTTNDAEFTFTINGLTRTYKADELLFDGMDGQVAPDGRIELTFSFSVSRGIYPDDEDSHQTVGDITVTDKPGWHYLWVHTIESTDSHSRVRTPRAVYIVQVYKQGDFELLRLDD